MSVRNLLIFVVALLLAPRAVCEEIIQTAENVLFVPEHTECRKLETYIPQARLHSTVRGATHRNQSK